VEEAGAWADSQARTGGGSVEEAFVVVEADFAGSFPVERVP